MGGFLFLLVGLGSGGAAASEKVPWAADLPSLRAARELERVASRDPRSLSEAEGRDWSRARLAWIALLRLEGDEAKALELFRGCGEHCARHGDSQEWAATQRWGCGKISERKLCQKK